VRFGCMVTVVQLKATPSGNVCPLLCAHPSTDGHSEKHAVHTTRSRTELFLACYRPFFGGVFHLDLTLQFELFFEKMSVGYVCLT